MLVSFYLSADAAEGHLDTGNRKVDAAAAGVLPVLHWWLLTIYTEIYRNKTFIPVNWYSFLTCTTSFKGKYQHVRKMKKGKLTPQPMDQLLKRMNEGTFADPRSVSWSVHPPAAGPQFLSERNEPHWPQHRPLPPQTWGRKSLLERLIVNDICDTLQALRGCRRFLSLQTWQWGYHHHPDWGGASAGWRRLAADQDWHPKTAHPAATAAAAEPEEHPEELPVYRREKNLGKL